MKKLCFAVWFILCGLESGIAQAQEQKEMPRQLHVQGKSAVRVSMEALRLDFTYPVEKNSFQDAAAAAKTIQKNMMPKLKSADKIKVKAVMGWDVLKQSKISIGDKGRKVDARVTFELENIPEGALFEVLSIAVDSALQADDKIKLELVEAYIPMAKEREIKMTLYKEAAADALRQAQQMAEGAEMQLGSLRFISSDDGPLPHMELAQSMEFSAPSAHRMQLRKSFKVPSEAQDETELELSVRAVYDLK